MEDISELHQIRVFKHYKTKRCFGTILPTHWWRIYQNSTISKFHFKIVETRWVLGLCWSRTQQLWNKWYIRNAPQDYVQQVFPSGWTEICFLMYHFDVFSCPDRVCGQLTFFLKHMTRLVTFKTFDLSDDVTWPETIFGNFTNFWQFWQFLTMS